VGELIYGLCGLASVACALLLGRGPRQPDARLLTWSSACFWLLALNNALLFVDLVLVPRIDLSLLPQTAALAALLALLVGFIWEAH
jgi:hypothetical protein